MAQHLDTMTVKNHKEMVEMKQMLEGLGNRQGPKESAPNSYGTYRQNQGQRSGRNDGEPTNKTQAIKANEYYARRNVKQNVQELLNYELATDQYYATDQEFDPTYDPRDNERRTMKSERNLLRQFYQHENQNKPAAVASEMNPMKDKALSSGRRKAPEKTPKTRSQSQSNPAGSSSGGNKLKQAGPVKLVPVVEITRPPKQKEIEKPKKKDQNQPSRKYRMMRRNQAQGDQLKGVKNYPSEWYLL
ncbi:hypothetical protein C8R46DRAFT_1023800 [Mycena filopes]|nr:hypothetical protein C8R46DRAFT_1023800 [Mycena filopes]